MPRDPSDSTTQLTAQVPSPSPYLALTNSFFLKDRCSLSNQISFILASNWRAFILAMRDNRANKNEIETFVFSVTLNDFPHDMLLLERGCRAVRMPQDRKSTRLNSSH